MSETAIVALVTALGGLVAGILSAYIALRKLKPETNSIDADTELKRAAAWDQLVNGQAKQIADQSSQIGNLAGKVSALETIVTNLQADLRRKDEIILRQDNDIHNLRLEVVELTARLARYESRPPAKRRPVT
jgi:chromosome segregation ATPase